MSSVRICGLPGAVQLTEPVVLLDNRLFLYRQRAPLRGQGAQRSSMVVLSRSTCTHRRMLRIGLTFDEIAKAVGRDEVWVAAAFYGQVCRATRLQLELSAVY